MRAGFQQSSQKNKPIENSLFLSLFGQNSLSYTNTGATIRKHPSTPGTGYIAVSTQKFRTMGIIWDILQQDELDKQEKKAKNLEERVEQLEADLEITRGLLKKTLVALEQHLSRDIDGDGVTG